MRAALIFSLGASVLLGTGAILVARVGMAPAKASVGHALAPATVPVVVAGAALAYGDALAPGKLAVVGYPAGLAPQGAYASIAQLTGSGQGGPPIALAPIARREPILPGKISGPGARNAVAAEIAPGLRAYAVKISDVAGVGGHLLPGDYVDVVLTREPPEHPGTQPGKAMVSDVVVQDVRLLGINLNADPASTAQAKTADPHTATLEVSLDDAQRLAVAAGVGTLSLALRRAGASDTVPARQVMVADLSPAAAAAPEARSVRVRTKPRRLPSGPAQASVLVVQGDHDASVSVPVEGRAGAAS